MLCPLLLLHFTESEWLGLEGTSGDCLVQHLPAQTGSAKAHCPGPRLLGFCISPVMQTPWTVQATSSGVRPPHWEKNNKINAFLCLNWMCFSVSVYAPCLLSFCWALARRVWLHLLYLLPLSIMYFHTLIWFLWTFSRLNSPSLLSISIYVGCSSPFIIFVLFCGTHSSIPSSFHNPFCSWCGSISSS